MPWKQYWPVADGHADTLTAGLEQNRSFFRESTRGHLDLARLGKAGLDLQVLAVCSENRPTPYEWAVKLVQGFIAELQELNDQPCILLKEAEDWQRWEAGGKVGVLLALEGLEPLEGNIERLEEFYGLGIRMVSLTWNYANSFAAGVLASGGLTVEGRKIIRRLSDLKMAIDLSHLHPEGFWQIVRSRPSAPVLVTHTAVASLMPHPRTLSDDQIKAVADLGGTVGLALYPPFLTEGTATVDHALNHLEHILQIGGPTCPALGCDFDGIGATPEGMSNVTHLPMLFDEFEQRKWPPQVIQGMIGANLAAVLRHTAG